MAAPTLWLRISALLNPRRRLHIFPCEGVVNTNVFDWDGDYVVTVTDFLMMLSVCNDTDGFGWGLGQGDDCVDTNACNYANDPSEPCAYIDILGVCGGGCEADEDNDGICDDIDACIGIEDECGVCNGPGPTEVVIEDITILFDRSICLSSMNGTFMNLVTPPLATPALLLLSPAETL